MNESISRYIGRQSTYAPNFSWDFPPGKGKDKKTFTVTYKWMGNLEINYTAPIWLRISNDTNGRILRPIRIQFLAQRMVSPQDYLYQETKRLPIINYYTISSIV